MAKSTKSQNKIAQLADTRAQDSQALFIGTWAAIALIGRVLVKKGVVGQGDLLKVLKDAEQASLTIDPRHVPFGAVHTFIDRLDGASAPSAPVQRTARARHRPLAATAR